MVKKELLARCRYAVSDGRFGYVFELYDHDFKGWFGEVFYSVREFQLGTDVLDFLPVDALFHVFQLQSLGYSVHLSKLTDPVVW